MANPARWHPGLASSNKEDMDKGWGAPIIDVVQLGYYIVLREGKFPKQAVIVKVKFFCRKAETIKGVRSGEKRCLGLVA